MVQDSDWLFNLSRVTNCFSKVWGFCQDLSYKNSNIWLDNPYFSVSSPNAGKCGPEKLRIRTLFTQSLSRRYPPFSLTTIWGHAAIKIEVRPKQIKKRGGHKPKLILHEKRSIIRSLHYVRKQDGNFTSKGVKLCSGASSVYDRTVCQVIN